MSADAVEKTSEDGDDLLAEVLQFPSNTNEFEFDGGENIKPVYSIGDNLPTGINFRETILGIHISKKGVYYDLLSYALNKDGGDVGAHRCERRVSQEELMRLVYSSDTRERLRDLTKRK